MPQYLSGYTYVGLLAPWGNFKLASLRTRLMALDWHIEDEIDLDDIVSGKVEIKRTTKVMGVWRENLRGGIYLTSKKEILVPDMIAPLV